MTVAHAFMCYTCNSTEDIKCVERAYSRPEEHKTNCSSADGGCSKRIYKERTFITTTWDTQGTFFKAVNFSSVESELLYLYMVYNSSFNNTSVTVERLCTSAAKPIIVKLFDYLSLKDEFQITIF